MSLGTTAATRIARNGFFNDGQILRAADAAHQAMRERYPMQLCAGIHFTSAPDGFEVASPAIRALLDALLLEQPYGSIKSASNIRDQHIVAAACAADAEGMVSLSFTDRRGEKRPTAVIDEFLLYLFTALNAAPKYGS
jgi:hypothetical protein